MKTFLYVFIAVVIGVLFIIVFIRERSTPRLLLNMENTYTLPARFHLITDHFPVAAEEKTPSAIGLGTLHASASDQFSEDSLSVMLTVIPSKNIFLVDLRQESHGFVDGMAVGWYGVKNRANVGKTVAEIEADESYRLNQLLQNQAAVIYVDKTFTDTLTVHVDRVATEAELAKKFGLSYKRIPTTDHERPSEASVDMFLKFVTTLPKDAWLHFHCSGGKGRSTTFLAMYDMLRNAQHVSFDDILLRQYLLGGVDLAIRDEESWKAPLRKERLEFLQEFYRYCKENINSEPR